VRDPSSEPRRFEIDRHRKKEVLIEGNELELLGSQYVYKLQDGKVEEDTLDVIAAFHDGVVYRLETSTVDTERRVSFNSVTAAKLERRRDCCVVQELYVKTSKTFKMWLVPFKNDQAGLPQALEINVRSRIQGVQGVF
jgi:hypothetical protein